MQMSLMIDRIVLMVMKLIPIFVLIVYVEFFKIKIYMNNLFDITQLIIFLSKIIITMNSRFYWHKSSPVIVPFNKILIKNLKGRI